MLQLNSFIDYVYFQVWIEQTVLFLVHAQNPLVFRIIHALYRNIVNRNFLSDCVADKMLCYMNAKMHVMWLLVAGDVCMTVKRESRHNDISIFKKRL